jgi:hypothetical protein
MFSSSSIKSCLQSFLLYVSSSSTQLLVNLRNGERKLMKLSSHNNHNISNLVESKANAKSVKNHKKCNSSNHSKVYIVIYLLISVFSISNCVVDGFVDNSSPSDDAYNIDEIGQIFHKVAYPTSTTTTKRSITDSIYVPSITTVPTPSLTTFRYVTSLTLTWLVCVPLFRINKFSFLI